MVVTGTLYLAMQIMLNGSNEFIVKLSNKQKITIIDASTRRKPPPSQQQDRPGSNPPFTVSNVTFICGIDSPMIFQADSQAMRISGGVFYDDLISCMDKVVKELNDDLKSYSTLTAANGQIRLNPGQKNNVQAFIQ